MVDIATSSKIEKRNRPPISCQPCRTRKLKCNRGLPCDTCVKRGKSEICQYAANADRTKSEAKRVPVADQLKRLEDIISTLATEKRSRVQIPAAADAERDPAVHRGPDEPQEPAVADGQPGYTDSTHWSSILEDIKDIREQLTPSNLSSDSSHQQNASSFLTTPSDSTRSSGGVSGPSLGFQRGIATSMEEILSSLPSREVCDFWVSHYFQARFTTLPLLLPSKFQNEYEAFWTAERKVSPAWAALLFSILSLAAGTCQLPDFGTGVKAKVPTVLELSTKTEQCLILGNYTEGAEYVMEALIMHLQSFYLRGRDANQEVWFAAGIILRLAFRLGYHRDPSTQKSLARLSPYRCEMRRRVWLSIYQMDALISFQMGLPSMIPKDFCDTRLPLNLELTDFDADTETLPPARPLTDYTTATYTIAKHPVLEMFKKIVAHTQALIPPAYEETIRLDGQLREAYEHLPGILKVKPIRSSLIDGTTLVIRRMTIELLFLKSVIILHRQHLAHHSNPTATLSHQLCLQAALTMLERQQEIHEAMRPGGLLYHDRWLLTALNMSDMIFASVIVCLDLTIRVTSRACACHFAPTVQPGDPVVNLQIELEAIKRSQAIWSGLSAHSSEARIAAGALEATIQRVQESQSNQALSVPYEDMQRITFADASVATTSLAPEDFQPVPDMLHWEFIDHWLLDTDEEMPDLAAWVLNGV